MTGSINPRRILWEKWTDPLLAAVNEHKEKTGWQDSYAYLERPGQIGAYQGPMLIGPAGFIPLNELNVPSRNFNLWIGHTSFVLDKPTIDRMKQVPGVEVFHLWSPYRFWLGVGRAFEENEVKKAVLAAASPPAAPDSIDVALEAMKKAAASRYQHWAVFVLKDGKLAMAGGNSREEVETQVREHADQTQQVIVSWNER